MSNEIFIITGGSGLLGESHCEAIAEIGGTPIVWDIEESSGSSLVEKINEKFNVDAVFQKVDITCENNVTKALKTLERSFRTINGLINNAAINPSFIENSNKFSRLENYSLESWNKEISVGLTGAFICSKHVGPIIAQNGLSETKVIVNISSDLGLIGPDQRIYKKDGLPVDAQPVKPVTYSVIKHGIIGLTKYLATYWSKQGVRVNSLSPGGVYDGQEDEFVEKLSNLIPLGRMAKKNEYKGAIKFLCSKDSSYMTGANLVIDGGRSAW